MEEYIRRNANILNTFVVVLCHIPYTDGSVPSQNIQVILSDSNIQIYYCIMYIVYTTTIIFYQI